MKNEKLTKEALAYIKASLRVSYFDCSDSHYDSEKYLNRFNSLAEDKINIGDYIEKFCLEEYIKIFQEFYDSELKDFDGVNRDEIENPTVADTPIHFSKIKNSIILSDLHK